MSSAAHAIATYTKEELATIQHYEQKIAARAYEIWQQEGEVHGNHERHWFQAVKEITAESAQWLEETLGLEQKTLETDGCLAGRSAVPQSPAATK